MEKIINEVKTGISNKRTRIAMLTYLVFFLPRLTDLKEDRELHYHMRQAIGLLVTALSLQGIISILGYWGFPTTVSVWPVRFVLLYLVIVGMRNALRNRMEPLPWIGKYSERVF